MRTRSPDAGGSRRRSAEEPIATPSRPLLLRLSDEVAPIPSRSLLQRFEGVEDVDMPLASRLAVPLEQRIGDVKGRRFRKHNRAKKRERREAERLGLEYEEERPEGMSGQRWDGEDPY
jgi:hypothetical protein